MEKKMKNKAVAQKKEMLEVKHVSILFEQYKKGLKKQTYSVVKDLNVTIYEGELLAIVGASGSGKSLLAHSILGLLPYNAKVTGEMYYKGEKLATKYLESLRGKEIAFVPQSTNYLDPLMRVGQQVCKSQKDTTIKKKQEQLFAKYGLSKEVTNYYPHQCSGGMMRRILLLTALMEEPNLIIADEPTPGMELSLAKKSMKDLREFAKGDQSVLLITHDLELAIEVADRIAVFYDGTILEVVAASNFLQEDTLRHPYTKALFRAMPQHGFCAPPKNIHTNEEGFHEN